MNDLPPTSAANSDASGTVSENANCETVHSEETVQRMTGYAASSVFTLGASMSALKIYAKIYSIDLRIDL